MGDGITTPGDSLDTDGILHSTDYNYPSPVKASNLPQRPIAEQLFETDSMGRPNGGVMIRSYTMTHWLMLLKLYTQHIL